MSMSSTQTDEASILDKLDTVVPVPLSKFDAFPKIPSTYKARSESRGFMTILVTLLGFLLLLNDISEYIWGWPDQEFSIDNNKQSYLDINVDITVNMPCEYLSVDLRDAIGDRLFLSGTVSRDGTTFDTSQATQFLAHSRALSVSEAVAQSRKSRGLFAFIRRLRSSPAARLKTKHQASSEACRIWGSLAVKRVTANLHITTLGHGYSSYEHVPHDRMNLSHVIDEFSFGPFFPDITQPLDYSVEVTHDPFVAYQYFLHVVPTTYIAPRSKPLDTNQYSVTHYTRVLEHNRGTPGIFFKFDLDPMRLTIHQRTTSLVQLFIRCVGVLGGLFVCTSYAIRITTRAVEVVSGSDQAKGIVAAESTGVGLGRGLKSKWAGGELRSRNSKVVRQGNGWAVEGSGYASDGYSSYAGTPVSNGFASPGYSVQSPFAVNSPVPPSAGPGVGLGVPSSAFATNFPSSPSPAPPMNGRSISAGSGFSTPALVPTPGTLTPAPPSVPASVPATPGVWATFPSSPNGNGVTVGPPPRRGPPPLAKKDD